MQRNQETVIFYTEPRMVMRTSKWFGSEPPDLAGGHAKTNQEKPMYVDQNVKMRKYQIIRKEKGVMPIYVDAVEVHLIPGWVKFVDENNRIVAAAPADSIAYIQELSSEEKT